MRNVLFDKFISLLFYLSVNCLVSAGASLAEDGVVRSYGGTIYVPTFSYLSRNEPVATTLVVHNIDPSASIRLHSVQFFGSEGAKVMDFLKEPVELQPLQSRDFMIGRRDNTGGTGSNFLVSWTSQELTADPATIALMFGGSGTQGLSFTTFGYVINRNMNQ